MQHRAFTLADEYTGTVEGSDTPVYGGGLIRIGEHEVNVADLLEAGNGFIVVDTSTVLGQVAADVLYGRPELEPVDVDPADHPAKLTAYDLLPFPTIRREALTRGITPVPRSRDEVVARLIEDDHRRAAGTNSVPNADDIIDDDPADEAGTTEV